MARLSEFYLHTCLGIAKSERNLFNDLVNCKRKLEIAVNDRKDILMNLTESNFTDISAAGDKDYEVSPLNIIPAMSSFDTLGGGVSRRFKRQSSALNIERHCSNEWMKLPPTIYEFEPKMVLLDCWNKYVTHCNQQAQPLQHEDKCLVQVTNTGMTLVLISSYNSLPIEIMAGSILRDPVMLWHISQEDEATTQGYMEKAFDIFSWWSEFFSVLSLRETTVTPVTCSMYCDDGDLLKTYFDLLYEPDIETSLLSLLMVLLQYWDDNDVSTVLEWKNKFAFAESVVGGKDFSCYLKQCYFEDDIIQFLSAGVSRGDNVSSFRDELKDMLNPTSTIWHAIDVFLRRKIKVPKPVPLIVYKNQNYQESKDGGEDWIHLTYDIALEDITRYYVDNFYDFIKKDSKLTPVIYVVIPENSLPTFKVLMPKQNTTYYDILYGTVFEKASKEFLKSVITPIKSLPVGYYEQVYQYVNVMFANAVELLTSSAEECVSTVTNEAVTNERTANDKNQEAIMILNCLHKIGHAAFRVYCNEILLNKSSFNSFKEIVMKELTAVEDQYDVEPVGVEDTLPYEGRDVQRDAIGATALHATESLYGDMLLHYRVRKLFVTGWFNGSITSFLE